jgi:signal transduction histidine kinase
MAPMPAQPALSPIRRVGATELSLLVLLFLLAGSGIIVAVDPRVAPATTDVELDVALTTLATLVSGALALLFWGRAREGEGLETLLRASAFAALGVLSLATLVAVVSGADRFFGMSLEAPGQLPILVGLVARAIAASLLAAAGLAALRGLPTPRRSAPAIALVPAIVVLVLIGVGVALQDRLPVLITPAGLAQVQERPGMILGVPGAEPILILGQTVIGLVFLLASGLSYRLFLRDRRPSEPLLAVGFTIAAFSQLHAAMHPGTYSGLVSTADLLRIAFYAVLLVAVIVEARADVRALREAHATLSRMRDAELAAAALEERARLAREIHDGLAQDLWYAKLRQARLSQLMPEGGEGRQLVGEVATAIDGALAEARQAVMALRPQIEPGAFDQVVARYVEDFGDRFGVRTELQADASLPPVAPRAQAEMLRILQEALNNVRKHADATVVRVRLEAENRHVRLEVADNGRGFDVAATPSQRFGLESMRQRAELVGGTLAVESRPQDGTRVWVEVPVREDAP